jgi:hypothetical protein
MVNLVLVYTRRRWCKFNFKHRAQADGQQDGAIKFNFKLKAETETSVSRIQNITFNVLIHSFASSGKRKSPTLIGTFLVFA